MNMRLVDRSLHAKSPIWYNLYLPLQLWVIFLVGIPLSGATEEDSRVQLQQTVERLKSLETWVENTRGTLDDGQKEVKRHDESIARLNQEIVRTEANLAETKDVVADLLDSVDDLNANTRDQAQAIADTLKSASRIENRGFIYAILNQKNLDELDRLTKYHGYLTKARVEAVQEYQKTASKLKKTISKLTLEQENHKQQLSELETRQTAKGAVRQAREALNRQLHSTLVQKNKEREALNLDRTRLEALIKQIAQETGSRNDKNVTSGNFIWPVSGTLAHRFGDSRAGGRLKWDGIFLIAEPGTPIMAVASGILVFADWLRGFGLIAIIDHGNNQMTLYGHCDVLYKSQGELVETGEPIGIIGQSGGATQNGLFFAIRSNGKPTDPLTQLPRL